MPDEAPWAEPVVVPDDLRALQADVDAYHREQRLLARRERIERATAWLPPFVTARLVGRLASSEPVAGPSLWTRLALPIAAFVGVLGAAALVLAVLLIGTPRPQAGPQPEPVATAPAAAIGSLGGLLPDVRVTTPGGVVALRSLRPALVALVPQPCACDRVLAALAAQADEFHLRLIAVAPTAQDAQLDALAGRLHRGRLIPADDASGALAAAYQPEGVTALVVGPDATVTYRVDRVAPTIQLEQELQDAVSPPPALSVG